MSEQLAFKESINILYFEDNPIDFEVVERWLRPSKDALFNLENVQGLGEGLKILDVKDYDVILLDLGLPDSHYFETLQILREKVPQTPIIIVTARDHEGEALDKVRQGAADYLVKGEFDAATLRRVIRFSIERSKLMGQLEEHRLVQERKRESEIMSEEGLSWDLKSLNPPLLRELAPVAYSQLIQEYEHTLELALNSLVYRNQKEIFSSSLQSLAKKLADKGAGPRDILGIHKTGLERKILKISSEGRRSVVEEARFVLLELMGYLLLIYRSRFAQSRSAPLSGPQEDQPHP